MKKIIKRTWRTTKKPLEDMPKAYWRCTVQVLVEDAPEVWQDSIADWSKDLAGTALNYVALQVRCIGDISDISERYPESIKLRDEHRGTALHMVSLIEKRGGTIICIQVERPAYLPKELDGGKPIIDNVTELFVRDPKWVIERLREEVHKRRHKTNIQEWRDSLDWIDNIIKTLQSHKTLA